MEAAAGAWLSSDKRNCWPATTPEAVVTAAASYSPFVIAEVRLSTGTASLVRALPKRGSMNSALHWQGGPPPVVRTAHTIADLE
jgi:hypothetical protein